MAVSVYNHDLAMRNHYSQYTHRRRPRTLVPYDYIFLEGSRFGHPDQAHQYESEYGSVFGRQRVGGPFPRTSPEGDDDVPQKRQRRKTSDDRAREEAYADPAVAGMAETARDSYSLRNRAVPKGITENWFDSGKINVQKKIFETQYRIADVPGTIETLEGPTKYKAGEYIMTGTEGEQYAISPERFHELKTDLGNGRCINKVKPMTAKLADHDGDLTTPDGRVLEYKAGKNYIVRYGKDDYGVVKLNIFSNTYDIIPPRYRFI